MKNKFWNNVKRYLGFYIGCLVIIPTASFLFTYLQVQIPEDKKLSIFIAEKESNVNYDDLKDYYSSIIIEKGIEEFNGYCASVDSLDFGTYFQAYGIGLSDLIILPESFYSESFAYNYLSPIRENGYVDSLKYSDSIFGIKVYDNTSKKSQLSSYINFEKEENYYLSINKNSLHYPEYQNKTNSLLESIMLISKYEE